MSAGITGMIYSNTHTQDQIFEASMNALFAQGCRAVKTTEADGTVCMYNAVQEDGTCHHCAVGLLMSDEELEKYGDLVMGASGLVARIAQDQKRFAPTTVVTRLFGILQGIHDSAYVHTLEQQRSFSRVLMSRIEDERLHLLDVGVSSAAITRVRLAAGL